MLRQADYKLSHADPLFALKVKMRSNIKMPELYYTGITKESEKVDQTSFSSLLQGKYFYFALHRANVQATKLSSGWWESYVVGNPLNPP